MNRATRAQNEQPVIVCSSNLFANFVERASSCHQGLSRFPQRKATKSFTNIHGFGSNQITFQASVKLWRFGGLKISALDSKPRGVGSRSGRVLNSLSLSTQEYKWVPVNFHLTSYQEESSNTISRFIPRQAGWTPADSTLPMNSRNSHKSSRAKHAPWCFSVEA